MNDEMNDEEYLDLDSEFWFCMNSISGHLISRCEQCESKFMYASKGFVTENGTAIVLKCEACNYSEWFRMIDDWYRIWYVNTKIDA